MYIKRSFIPHTAADIGCFLLLFTFIPITFVFELVVVLPEFHEPNGVLYNLTWVAGLFLVFNIIANMLACMLVDTSIKPELLTPPSQPAQRKYWHFCADCETLVPPRSWHCQICSTCILKRDHHCLFVGCCIGHRNQRYFMSLMFHMVIGCGYTTIYNSLYFYYLHGEQYANLMTFIKMLFPMFMVVVDVSWCNFYLLIYELNVIAFAYVVVLIIYHMPMILDGAVIYERNAPKYNLGWRRNLEMVLGERMYLVFLSPFIKSKLPHDGIHWESVLQYSSKNR